MWEPRRLTNLWASTACYRHSFTVTSAINAKLSKHFNHLCGSGFKYFIYARKTKCLKPMSDVAVSVPNGRLIMLG
jgi:hypothetical protein